MDKVFVGRRNYRRQKRYAKEKSSLRCIRINILRHHTTQVNKPRFDKTNRSQASSCCNDEYLVTTNEFSNTLVNSPFSLRNEIKSIKRLDELPKKMIPPPTANSGKNLNAITTIMKKADVLDLELTMLIEKIKKIFTKLQILLLELDIKTQTHKTSIKTQIYFLNISLTVPKFPSLTSLEYKQKKEENKSQQKLACLQKQKILFKENRQFKINIAQRSIRFQISIDRFITFSVNFLQTFVNIKKCWHKDSNTDKSKSVASLYVRDWHIRNMTQWYQLSILLRNCNVASLNVMRNLYFVIITSVTPNINIEFNFKLPYELIMAYELKSETNSPFETIYFNEEHKQILDKAPHMNTTMLHLDDNKQLMENVIMSNYSEYSYNTVSTLKRQPSQTTTSDESDTYLSSLSEIGSEYFEFEADSKTTVTESLNTLTYSIEDKVSYHSVFNRKDFADLNFKDFLRDNLNGYNTAVQHTYSTAVQQGKTWITNLLRNSNLTKGNLNNFSINESLFDFLSLDYVDSIVDNLPHLQLHDFCKLFVKDLGICMINTLFNYYPVPVNI